MGGCKAWGWTWHPAQAACPGEARFWPAQLWKQTASSGVPESSCPSPAVQRITVHMNSWIRRAWKISRCLSVLGTHWHLSWLSRSWELRQLLLQHHTNSNIDISPFPSKPPVTFSATSIFYSSLHKPAPWGQWPRCGNALRPWHISSWRNQGWDTSFNLPFQRLQSGTSTDLGEYISECSKHPYTMVKDPEKDSLCIKVRMHLSQQRCSAFCSGDLRRCIMKHWGSGSRNNYKHRQALAQGSERVFLRAAHRAGGQFLTTGSAGSFFAWYMHQLKCKVGTGRFSESLNNLLI